MKDIGLVIRENLLKRQVSLEKYNEQRKSFFQEKEQIIKDIEEAREIWINTLKQLPNKEF